MQCFSLVYLQMKNRRKKHRRKSAVVWYDIKRYDGSVAEGQRELGGGGDCLIRATEQELEELNDPNKRVEKRKKSQIET